MVERQYRRLNRKAIFRPQQLGPDGRDTRPGNGSRATGGGCIHPCGRLRMNSSRCRCGGRLVARRAQLYQRSRLLQKRPEALCSNAVQSAAQHHWSPRKQLVEARLIQPEQLAQTLPHHRERFAGTNIAPKHDIKRVLVSHSVSSFTAGVYPFITFWQINVIHVMPHNNRLSSTAAEPMSFACLANGWYSVLTRSTAFSTAELSSSTINTATSTAISTSRSRAVSPSHQASGSNSNVSSTSTRKASSV